MIAVRVLVFVAGGVLVLAVISSSIRTIVLPRAASARIVRAVFLATRGLFEMRIGRRAPYERRDRVMALYAPIALVALLLTWLALVFAGFGAMFWAHDGGGFGDALTLSGSAIFTLGFDRPPTAPDTALAFCEAAVGLAELALLIGYLPTIYGAFSRRERLVTKLEVRAGSPPSGVVMLARFWILGRSELLSDEVWSQWEDWFVDVEESHTSHTSLPFFRSPQPDHHWVTAAGAVLDAASLLDAAVDVPHGENVIRAQLCIRAGYLCLRRIADSFGVPYDPDPAPTAPISVAREEFDAACDALAQAGVPLRPDRELAWRDFAGWRVNYDVVLLVLAGITSAPLAPWSSDRGLTGFRPPLLRRRARVGR